MERIYKKLCVKCQKLRRVTGFLVDSDICKACQKKPAYMPILHPLLQAFLRNPSTHSPVRSENIRGPECTDGCRAPSGLGNECLAPSYDCLPGAPKISPIFFGDETDVNLTR